MVICLGFGVDYDILPSIRIGEEVHKGMDTNDVIGHSKLQAGSIITICGVVRVSSFRSLIMTNNPMLMMFGLGLMSTILLDAIIVRKKLGTGDDVTVGKMELLAPG